MKQRILASFRLTIATLFMLFSANLSVLLPTAHAVADDKVTICHGTDSVTNPYNQESVNADSADGDTSNDHGQADHSTHTGPIATSETVAQALKDAKTAWGDIIPPHDSYAGLNWTTDGQAIWNNGCAYTTEVTPTAVTFNDVCGTANDTYTVPTTTGVDYSDTAGTHAGSGTVTITATPKTGFTLNGDTSWSHTFTNDECPVDLTPVTPADVTFNDVCGTDSDTYTVPTTTGVIYSVNAGTHPGSGTVTVTATADSGYVLEGTTSWTHTFTDEDCPQPAKVTICHRTDSVVNPYQQETVDADSADGNTGNDNGQADHSEHTGPVATSEAFAQALKDAHQKWGDIIPPHDNYAGLNWTAEGQAVYNNDCNYPPVCPQVEEDTPLFLGQLQIEGEDEDCVPPTDVCPNLSGVQETVPDGLVVDDSGDCVSPPPTDVCPNIDGVQATIPSDKILDNSGNCVTPETGEVLGISTTKKQAELVNTGENPLASVLAGATLLVLAVGSSLLSRRQTNS
jgi:hypothetical protein